MRRVTAASLASAAPAARAAAAKEGNMTDIFAEPIAPVPACVLPAAADAPQLVAAPPRPAWRDRLAARFRRAPREDHAAPDPRVERFQTRRSGPSFPN